MSIRCHVTTVSLCLCPTSELSGHNMPWSEASTCPGADYGLMMMSDCEQQTQTVHQTLCCARYVVKTETVNMCIHVLKKKKTTTSRGTTVKLHLILRQVSVHEAAVFTSVHRMTLNKTNLKVQYFSSSEH